MLKFKAPHGGYAHTNNMRKTRMVSRQFPFIHNITIYMNFSFPFVCHENDLFLHLLQPPGVKWFHFKLLKLKPCYFKLSDEMKSSLK